MAKNEELSPLGRYEPGMNWNPVEKIIFERRSVRSFKKDPLPDSMINRILEAGRFAPTGGNSQSWKFVVINSPEIIAEMEKDAVDMAKKFMKLLDLNKRFRRWLAKRVIKLKKNELHPIPFSVLIQVAAEKVKVFHGAPTLLLIYSDTRGVGEPPIDLGIAGQNMVLTAHSLGAGTCWIGLYQLLMYKKKWRKFFKVDKAFKLSSSIALGYPKANYDGEVSREVQKVEWIEGTSQNPKKRMEMQGE